MMQDSTKLGIFLFALLAIGGLILLSRMPAAPVQSTPLYLKKRESESEAEVSGGRRYRNKEKWSIKWSEDGLPVEVTIERDAVQS